ncbi:hypothetical protein E2C01_032894 [Portunus trituberculatus]|uniref:Uncharacterized protein n=1 Tax=Portunus trituberculatus TaxID=210409 RepID=A0A5B7F2A0_PORTR|nr:hypothetical protein [Portunus trituberculatus]
MVHLVHGPRSLQAHEFESCPRSECSASRVTARAVKIPGRPIASPQLLQHCRQQHTDDRSVVKVLNMESDAGLMVDAISQIQVDTACSSVPLLNYIHCSTIETQ